MRILLAPAEVAGYMGRLRNGFLQQGQKAKFLDFSDNYLKYNEKGDFPSVMACRDLNRRLAGWPGFLRVAAIRPLRIALRAWFFLYSLAWPDVVIFCFGRTILGGWELPLYKLFRKRTFMVYLGSDSRPPYLNGYVITREQGIPIEECASLAGKMKRRIDWLDGHVDFVVDHAPCGHFHERPFVPFLALGLPAPIVDDAPPSPAPGGRIRILHAPSFPEAKGSAAIRQAIETLIGEGFPIDFVEIKGRPNVEVLEELRACSFIVDELYSDSVLASLGVEAASFGKATVVGGYPRDSDLGVDATMIPPAIRTRPENLLATLRDAIVTARYAEVGAAAYRFVRETWAADRVAGRFLRILEGGADTVGLIDKTRVGYIYGWGFPEDKLRHFLRAYLARFGAESLRLDGNPVLRDKIVSFAGAEGV